MTKYKEYVQKMMDAEKQTFADFKKIHDAYTLNEEKNQLEFNKQGEKVLKIIQEWESRLCQTSEKAGYSNYTGGLAEKFRAEIKTHFPMIDYIGIVTKKESNFFVKKISLR